MLVEGELDHAEDEQQEQRGGDDQFGAAPVVSSQTTASLSTQRARMRPGVSPRPAGA